MDRSESLANDILASLTDKCNYVADLIVNPLDYDKILSVAEEYMSSDQRNIYNRIKKRLDDDDDSNFDFRNNIYMISGLPGTGKSYLQTVIHLYSLRKAFKKAVLCLAPTNLIAHQQKGRTIHSQIRNILQLLSVKSYREVETLLASNLVEKYRIVKTFNELRKMSLSQLKTAILELARVIGSYTELNVMAETSEKMIILIDEGTMVSSLLFAVLFMGYSRAVFVITYGPNQLPPITGQLNLPDFEYAALADKCQHAYSLHTQLRFNQDRNGNIFKEFVEYFSDTLSGNESFSIETKLNKMAYFLKNLKLGGNLRQYHEMKRKNKILIVCTNKQRCIENHRRLMAEGEGRVHEIAAIVPDQLPSTYNLESQLGIDRVLKIRKGVLCMIRVNDLTAGLIKGMMAKINDIIVVEEKVEKIEITILETGQTKEVGRYAIETNYLMNPKSDELDSLMIHQFPITLAYSLTSYSSQGKTLDCDIGIDLAKCSFSNSNLVNSFFVALTRVRNPEQLYMNEHPVFWLEPDMNIHSLDDVERMRSKCLHTAAGPAVIPKKVTRKKKNAREDSCDNKKKKRTLFANGDIYSLETVLRIVTSSKK